jgi:purine nucleosidase
MQQLSRRNFLIRSSMAGLGALSLAPHLVWGHHRSFAKPKLIVDADTANEVDDLFAVVIALLEPNLDVLGITSAQWHTQKFAPNDSVGASQKLNQEMLALLNRQSVPHPEGANIPMVNQHRPQPSAAATFIIEQALSLPAGEKLHVAILGPATNLASAVLLEPRIIPKVVANYLGFWHHPESGTWSKREFNTNNDPNAIDCLLNTPGLELHIMTASTSQHLVFDKVEVDQHLKGKGGIADYLVNRWETYDRFWQESDKEKKHWIMWDVAIILALAYPDLANQTEVQTPHDNRDRLIHAYTQIDAESMQAKYWEVMDAYLG